jgi:hypothetical protein
MITCHAFRANLRPGSSEPELLEHLRHCDACLDHAVGVDPDFLFRSIGGEELVPPGGVDAFTHDVMQQLHVRTTETRLAHRVLSWPRRLAVAATIAAAMTSAAVVWQHEQNAAVPMQAMASATMTKRVTPAAVVASLTTKPVVETYDSKNATIVEVPSEGANDVKVVMIFDEQLPADL